LSGWRTLRSASPSTGLRALVSVYAIATLLVAIDPEMARLQLGRFHLRTQSFALWALLAPSPWMYAFENRARLSPRPLTARELDDADSASGWIALNHQTARIMTFAEMRRTYPAPSTTYVYLAGRYRKETMQTAYVVRHPSADEGRSATITRLPPW